MSREFDSRKDPQSTKFELIPQIFALHLCGFLSENEIIDVENSYVQHPFSKYKFLLDICSYCFLKTFEIPSMD